jgi:hypothetical protein
MNITDEPTLKAISIDPIKVAEAIELLHAVRFVSAHKPTEEDRADLGDVYAIALNRAVHLRIFQKAGISSKVVARAVRAGVLGVIEVDGTGTV